MNDEWFKCINDYLEDGGECVLEAWARTMSKSLSLVRTFQEKIKSCRVYGRHISPTFDSLPVRQNSAVNHDAKLWKLNRRSSHAQVASVWHGSNVSISHKPFKPSLVTSLASHTFRLIQERQQLISTPIRAITRIPSSRWTKYRSIQGCIELYLSIPRRAGCRMSVNPRFLLALIHLSFNVFMYSF